MMAPPSPAPARIGNLIVLSAPSGTGKTTLARALVARLPDLAAAVSFTTRPRRAGERDGVDYHFVDRDAFVRMAEGGGFLEWAEIYGHLYGTGREATERVLHGGQDLLLVIDVQGARWVRRRMPDAVLIFVLPPGYDALLQRLDQRGTESSGTRTQRLVTAREEIRAWPEYDFLVINDDLEAAGTAAEAIVRAARQTRARLAGAAEAIVASFPPPGRRAAGPDAG
jgi:guanylate kinase